MSDFIVWFNSIGIVGQILIGIFVVILCKALFPYDPYSDYVDYGYDEDPTTQKGEGG